MSDMQPYGGEDEIFRYFNQVERSLFDGLGAIFGPFRSELSDHGEQYLLKIALPGFRREDICLEVKDGFLTVRAVRRRDDSSHTKSADGFCRQFTLAGVRSEEITASYQDGLLTVCLPKSRPEDGLSGRRIPIQ
ncbi:MAG: Hsp20 family protein [Clostridiales bacterium]|nr:Hsp20 family protein [Clostridiales bacterium]